MSKNVFFIKVPQEPVNLFESTKLLCPCKVFSTTTTITRLLGRFPLTWKHNGKCIYEVSTIWLAYSLVFTVVLIVATYYTMPQIKLDIKNLPEFLSNLSNLLTLVYLVIGLMHFIEVQSWVSLTECLGSFGQDFSCQKARRSTNHFQKVLFRILCSLVLLQGLLVFSLRLPLHVAFFKSLQVLPQFFYVLCITCKLLVIVVLLLKVGDFRCPICYNNVYLF